jgi:hypothetical protein
MFTTPKARAKSNPIKVDFFMPEPSYKLAANSLPELIVTSQPISAC